MLLELSDRAAQSLYEAIEYHMQRGYKAPHDHWRGYLPLAYVWGYTRGTAQRQMIAAAYRAEFANMTDGGFGW